MSEPTAKKNDYRRLVLLFWILVFTGILSVFSVFLLAYNGYFGELPTFEEIENPKSNLASQIISADGEVLGKYYAENRTHVEFEEISPNVINALVATEDERFFEHSGIDFRSLTRAVVNLGKKGGASTITQQLAKNLFNEPARSLEERLKQKLKEWVIAIQLERQYTKNEIITMYLNQFDFLYQGVGIHSASRIYFDKTPAELKIEEAALLVGMVKNPTIYNPVRESTKDTALQRRNQVMYQMVRNEYITKDAADSLSQLPLDLKFNRQDHVEGLATYFREYLRAYMTKWLAENRKPDGSKYNLYTDGLKIYTTIDSRMQAHAEAAVKTHMTNLQSIFFKTQEKRSTAPFYHLTKSQINSLLTQAMKRTPRYKSLKAKGTPQDSIDLIFNTPVEMKVFSWEGDIDTVLSPMDSIRYYKHFYNVGMMSMEPSTGFVKAWVGGINYKHFKYDHVKQSKRQAGSTFKPYVYAEAIRQKGYSPCMEVPNVKTCIEAGLWNTKDDWCPSNSNDKYGGMLALKDALATSTNTVTTQLMKEIGPGAVKRLAQKMGVTSDIMEVPSIALGTVDISVYDLVGSYTTFANKGIYTQPIMVTRIEDKNGIVLADFHPQTREVMSEEDAYVITNLLKGVTTSRGGSGTRLRNGKAYYRWGSVTGHPYQFTNPIAGKTGTTQNNSDGWFIGMVPNLITGVWAGCEDRSAHFGSILEGQGATTSLPIWALYMKACYADTTLNVSQEDFKAPLSPISIELNCERYKESNQQEVETDPEMEEFI